MYFFFSPGCRKKTRCCLCMLLSHQFRFFLIAKKKKRKNDKEQQQQQQHNNNRTSNQLRLDCFVVLLITANYQLCDVPTLSSREPSVSFFLSLLFLPVKNLQKHGKAIIQRPGLSYSLRCFLKRCAPPEEKVWQIIWGNKSTGSFSFSNCVTSGEFFFFTSASFPGFFFFFSFSSQRTSAVSHFSLQLHWHGDSCMLTCPSVRRISLRVIYFSLNRFAL